MLVRSEGVKNHLTASTEQYCSVRPGKRALQSPPFQVRKNRATRRCIDYHWRCASPPQTLACLTEWYAPARRTLKRILSSGEVFAKISGGCRRPIRSSCHTERLRIEA